VFLIKILDFYHLVMPSTYLIKLDLISIYLFSSLTLHYFLSSYFFTLFSLLNSLFFSCKDDVPSALEKFSALRASDASAVVKMSERLDGGFFSFVLPLIVDSIFHKLMPKIFSPNTIKAIQDPNKTFTQVKLRWVMMICNSLLSV
jgi:hypothetical protein